MSINLPELKIIYLNVTFKLMIILVKNKYFISTQLYVNYLKTMYFHNQ